MVISMQTLKRALCLCLALSFSVLLTGCRRNVGNTNSSMVESTGSAVSSALPSPSPEVSDPLPGSSVNPSDPAGSADGADIQQLYRELKSTYGENYYPTKRLNASELEEQFGISTDLYSEFIADTSSEEGVPDTLVIIKALEGMEQEVETKLKASKVYSNGAYVFYVMLGDVTDDTLSGEGLMEALGKEIDKGIDAIEKFFDDMM